MFYRGLPFGLAAILCGASLYGQAFSDHAAAVAGAAAGVAAATAIKDPLSRLLDAASGAASTAAGAPEPAKPARKTSQSTPAKAAGVPDAGAAQASPTLSASPATGGGSGQSSWRRPAGSRPVLPVGQGSFNYYGSPQESSVTPAELKSVASGTSNADVVAKLGTPAARITMDDGGRLVEILEYTQNGTRVGSVHCSDGRVESVDAADR